MTTSAHAASITSELVVLGRRLLRGAPADEAFEQVVQSAKRSVPGCSFASFSGRPAGNDITTLAATDDEAILLDRLQFDFGGPCLEALRANDVVSVPDVAVASRWPRFAGEAARYVRSVLSTPLADELQPQRIVGLLNVYGVDRFAFDSSSSAAAKALASHVGLLLSMTATIGQLERALESRDVIGQAKGILMARGQVSPDTAFAMLRRASQRQNRKLREVASDLVDGVWPDPTTADG